MPRLVVTWLSNCVALLAASEVIRSIGYGHRIGTLLLAGAIFGVVNFAIRPLVILLTLPFVILTLGFGLLVVNAFMLWLTSRIVTGFHVGGFWATVGGALIVWLVNLALRPWTGPGKRRRPDGPSWPHGRRRRRPQIS
jgi:putative membrane protein